MRNVVSKIESVAAKLIDDNTLADFGFSVKGIKTPDGKKLCDLTVLYRHDTAIGDVKIRLTEKGICRVNIVSSPQSICKEMTNFNAGLKRIIKEVNRAIT